MSTSYDLVSIIVRNKPPQDFDDAIKHRGQLYLDSSSGELWTARRAGRDVPWRKLEFGGASAPEGIAIKGILEANEDAPSEGVWLKKV